MYKNIRSKSPELDLFLWIEDEPAALWDRSRPEVGQGGVDVGTGHVDSNANVEAKLLKTGRTVAYWIGKSTLYGRVRQLVGPVGVGWLGGGQG